VGLKAEKGIERGNEGEEQDMFYTHENDIFLLWRGNFAV